MNKRFFKFEKNLSIKRLLEYLNISDKFFYEYNSKNINIDGFKINQFSSLSNFLIILSANFIIVFNLPNDMDFNLHSAFDL